MENIKIIQSKITQLNQITNKDMFIGMLSIGEIISVVKYTIRETVSVNPFDELDHSEEIENQYYQRVKDSDRAYKIKLFFLKQLYNKYTFPKNLVSPLAVFPSSIILGCQSYPDDISKDLFVKNIQNGDDKNLANEYVYIDLNKENGNILIPNNNHILIVDGQHRIGGLEKLLEEVLFGSIQVKKNDQEEIFIKNMPPLGYILEQLSDFKFLVTFLIDFDRYEQAELFAMVNFNQKPVNKSYYYDIFGSVQRGKTIEKLLHDLTAYLNFNDKSPLFGKIKMLGTGKGYFSQAFLVEAFLPLFKKGIFDNVLRDFQNNGTKYKKLPVFLRVFFSAVLTMFNEYMPKDGKYNHNLLKTTGMGAIIQLMPYVNKKLKERNSVANILDLDEEQILRGVSEILSPIKNKGDIFFGDSGSYSKGTGKAFQSKLYKEILDTLVSSNIDDDDKNLFA